MTRTLQASNEDSSFLFALLVKALIFVAISKFEFMHIHRSFLIIRKNLSKISGNKKSIYLIGMLIRDDQHLQ